VNRIAQLWRTTTVRLTFMFIALFVVFSILLLTFIAYQSSIQIQQQQTAAIDREVNLIQRIDQRQGFGGVVYAVSRLAAQPGPGIYYLGDANGLQIAGNVNSFPDNVLHSEGVFSFTYDRGDAVDDTDDTRGFAVVRSLIIENNLRLIVGRDVVERRGFTSIVFQSFVIAVIGILVFSTLAGAVTAWRVIKQPATAVWGLLRGTRH